ncbi:MAG: deoxyribose-phosphate aldolase [Flavobacteriales bacterium]
MKLNEFLDSTYLKTPNQASLTQEQTQKKVEELIQEAIKYHFKLVMIRPDFVKLGREMIDHANSDVLVGTVIGFHEGTASIDNKLKEAQKAIEDGADELDFVVNYEAFKKEDLITVKEEIYHGTKICLENGKIAKWIIEIAALTDEQIASITSLIRNVVISNFGNKDAEKIFVKSSTGFYPTEDGKPSGATFEGIQIMKKNAGSLSIKAAGGVRTPEDAKKMIELGVTRIGTSSALSLAQGDLSENDY